MGNEWPVCVRLAKLLCLCAGLGLGAGCCTTSQCASKFPCGDRVEVVRYGVAVPEPFPAVERPGNLDLWTDDLTRAEVEADGSVMIQALIHDLRALQEGYEKCQIGTEAMIAARAHILRRQEEILDELEDESP